MRALSTIAPGVRPAAAAGVLALAVDCLYLAVLARQGGPHGSREALVAASLAAAAAAALGAPALDPPLRAFALAWSAATLWVWALVGLASIGLLIVPAAVLAALALTRLPAGRTGAAAASLGVALAVLAAAAGLAWTA